MDHENFTAGSMDQAEFDRQRLAKAAALEKHMRAWYAEESRVVPFDRWLSMVAMDLGSLQADLKRRAYETHNAKMSAAFDRVKNSLHWKNSINRTLPELSAEDEAVIREAVVYYTGSVPTFTRLPNGKVKVTAAGYYLTIGS